jgi:hypothetical protein
MYVDNFRLMTIELTPVSWEFLHCLAEVLKAYPVPLEQDRPINPGPQV